MATKRTSKRTGAATRRSAMHIASVPKTLTSKGFKVRGFGPLPEGFDPLTASARQLALHRLPRPPDGKAEPRAAKLWERVIGRTRLWISPEFEQLENIGRSPPRPTRSGHRKVMADRSFASNETSNNWSGAMVFAPARQPYRFVGGQWTVPCPHAPDFGSYWAVEWVGIDGWSSDDVLQAGTLTEIVNFGFASLTQVYAWWEWFPASWIKIPNLPVSPGDVMYCLICADSTTHATVYFSNQSTGVGTRFDITAPGSTTLTGNVAEWIVERPEVNGSLTELADYTACYFDECIAGTGLSNIDNLAAASLVTMTGAGSAHLSEPTKENDHLVKVNWRKAS